MSAILVAKIVFRAKSRLILEHLENSPKKLAILFRDSTLGYLMFGCTKAN